MKRKRRALKVSSVNKSSGNASVAGFEDPESARFFSSTTENNASEDVLATTEEDDGTKELRFEGADERDVVPEEDGEGGFFAERRDADLVDLFLGEQNK